MRVPIARTHETGEGRCWRILEELLVGRLDRAFVQMAGGLLEYSGQVATFGSGILGHRMDIKTDGCVFLG